MNRKEILDSCGNVLYRINIDGNTVSTTFTYNTLGHTFKMKLHLDGVDDIDEAERVIHNVYMNTCPDRLYEKEARIRELEQTVDQYEIEIDALKYDIDDLEDALEQAADTIADLRDTINTLEAELG